MGYPANTDTGLTVEIVEKLVGGGSTADPTLYKSAEGLIYRESSNNPRILTRVHERAVPTDGVFVMDDGSDPSESVPVEELPEEPEADLDALQTSAIDLALDFLGDKAEDEDVPADDEHAGDDEYAEPLDAA